MKRSMAALVLEEPGTAPRLKTVPVPAMGPNMCLVKVRACGMGLTLEHIRLGRFGGDTPRTLGHEFIGTVVDIDSNGPDGQAVTIGSTVVASFYLFCGACKYCRMGHEPLCENMRGYIGAHLDGGLAEYVLVPTRNVVPVPSAAQTADVGVVADALATPLHLATSRVSAQPDDRVVVIGAGGGVGVHACQVFRDRSAQVIAAEKDHKKLAALPELDVANEIVDTNATDWIGDILARYGAADIVVDLVGSEETLKAAVDLLAPRGRVGIVGLTPGAAISANAQRLAMKELTIAGTLYASRTDIAAALSLVAAKRCRAIIGGRLSLDDSESAFEMLRTDQIIGRLLIDVER